MKELCSACAAVMSEYPTSEDLDRLQTAINELMANRFGSKLELKFQTLQYCIEKCNSGGHHHSVHYFNPWSINHWYIRVGSAYSHGLSAEYRFCDLDTGFAAGQLLFDKAHTITLISAPFLVLKAYILWPALLAETISLNNPQSLKCVRNESCVSGKQDCIPREPAFKASGVHQNRHEWHQQPYFGRQDHRWRNSLSVNNFCKCQDLWQSTKIGGALPSS